MAANSYTQRDLRAFGAMVVGAAAIAAASPAHAQSCSVPLPTSANVPTAHHEKFRLVAQQCSVLSQPARVRRAAQLDLYERSDPVAVPMPVPALPEPSTPRTLEAPPSLPLPRAPTDATKLEVRVLSLAPAITDAARAHAIDPLLLHAIAYVESRHNTRAVSPAGARGVMQVMPATARRYGVTDPERALHDANTNLRASAAYLHTLRLRYAGDVRLMLAAYNAGEGAVEKHGRAVPPYRETQAYVRDVVAVYRRLQAEFSVSQSGVIVSRRGRS